MSKHTYKWVMKDGNGVAWDEAFERKYEAVNGHPPEHLDMATIHGIKGARRSEDGTKTLGFAKGVAELTETTIRVVVTSDDVLTPAEVEWIDMIGVGRNVLIQYVGNPDATVKRKHIRGT